MRKLAIWIICFFFFVSPCLASQIDGAVETLASIGAEPTQTAASQVEAEAGTEAAIRSWSPLRIFQGIASWWENTTHTAYESTEAAIRAAVTGGVYKRVIPTAAYVLTSNLTIPSGVEYTPIPGAVVTPHYSVAGGGSNWTVHSGSVYVSTANYNEIEFLRESGMALTEVAGAADIDAAGKWAWEANKIYVRTTGSVDPDTLGAGLLVAGHTLTFANGSHLKYNGGQMFDAAVGEVIIADGVVNTVNPRQWGALGDDVNDDTLAFECAMAVAGTYGVTITASRGVYLLTRVIHVPSHVKFVGDGGNGSAQYLSAPSATVLHGKHTGTSILSFKGSFACKISNINVYGDPTTTPKTGLLLGRELDLESAGTHTFDDVQVSGYFSSAGIYSIASEVNRWNNCQVVLNGGGALYPIYTSQVDELSVASLGGSTNIDVVWNGISLVSYVDDVNASLIYIDSGVNTKSHSFFGGYMAAIEGSYITIMVGFADTQSCPGPLTFIGMSGERISGNKVLYGFRVLTADGAARSLSGLTIIGSTLPTGVGGKFFYQDTPSLSIYDSYIKVPAQNNTSTWHPTLLGNTLVDEGVGTNIKIYGYLDVLMGNMRVQNLNTNYIPSTTYGAASVSLFDNAGVEIAIGTTSVWPYEFWLQARNNSNNPHHLMINPLGGNVLIGAPHIVGGTGTGLTVGSKGHTNRLVYMVTVTYSAFSDTDTTKGVVIGTLPAKCKIVGIYSDTTTKYLGGAITATTLKVGVTAEGAANIVAVHDVFTAAVTKGLADADLGTGMTRAAAIQGGYMPSWTGTTAVYATIDTTTANTDALTQGSTTIYLETEQF